MDKKEKATVALVSSVTTLVTIIAFRCLMFLFGK